MYSAFTKVTELQEESSGHILAFLKFDQRKRDYLAETNWEEGGSGVCLLLELFWLFQQKKKKLQLSVKNFHHYQTRVKAWG